MPIRSLLLMCAATMLLASMSPSTARADPDEKWQVNIRPYVWIAGMDGTFSGSGLPQVHVNTSFSDVLEHFDKGALVVLEAQRGKQGVYVDIMHIRLSDSGVVPPGVPARARTTTTSSLLAGQYEISSSEAYDLHALAGIRYWSLDLDAAVSFPPAAGGPVDISKSTSWVDPQFGVKGTFRVNPRLKLDGAIIVAPTSKASWDLSTNLAYSVSDHTDLILGYRYMTINRDKPSFKVDSSLQGPVIGLDFRF